MTTENITHAGSVLIQELTLISTKNVAISLIDFLVELNIYEDMFSNFLTGSIVITDSRNLIEIAPIIGDEYLTVKFKTPTTNSDISKTFRVYKVSDRTIATDNHTQVFVLHFASIELFYDITLPLFLPFEGEIQTVANNIFNNFLSTTRDYSIGSGFDIQQSSNTPLVFVGDISNKVKFVSPGWTPAKCINWLASKSIPLNGKAKNFLFFESNKAFYFASVEELFKDALINKSIIGEYYVSASNIEFENGRDLDREYFLAKNIVMISAIDNAKNMTTGYLANRLLTVDFYNKKFDVYDYDYTLEYKNQYHSADSGEKAIPPFPSNIMRNAASNLSYYPVNSKLYDNVSDNISEKISDIHGNRLSSLMDLNNIKMSIVVPGRTDVEVGRSLYFTYPALGSPGTESRSKWLEDSLYSGYYLITAIHHTVTLKSHYMTMEIIKDSFHEKYYD
jgi:hypothetical protein